MLFLCSKNGSYHFCANLLLKVRLELAGPPGVPSSTTHKNSDIDRHSGRVSKLRLGVPELNLQTMIWLSDNKLAGKYLQICEINLTIKWFCCNLWSQNNLFNYPEFQRIQGFKQNYYYILEIKSTIMFLKLRK